MEEASDTRAKEEATVEPEAAGATASEKKVFQLVVAVDDSDISYYALSWAIDFIVANRRDDYELVVLHAQYPIETFMYPVAGHAVYAASLATDTVRKANEENSKRIMSKAVNICKTKQVNPLTVIAEGDPKDAICETAEKLHANLLVVGSRGLGMIKRAFLGSVSDYLIHHARCPVMIVKPPKASLDHGKWIKVNERKTLVLEILQQKEYIIPAIPVFFVVSKKSSFYKEFISGKWSPP